MVELIKLTSLKEFLKLKKGDEVIVNWNKDGETWDKEMSGRKLYKILKVQKDYEDCEYADEIILRVKGNIFFNFRLFLFGESKIVKEVFVINDVNGVL